jgi:hypothetical protein
MISILISFLLNSCQDGQGIKTRFTGLVQENSKTVQAALPWEVTGGVPSGLRERSAGHYPFRAWNREQNG